MRIFSKIQNKFLAILLSIAIIPLLLVGIYTVIASTNALEKGVISSATKDVSLRAEKIKAFLHGTQSDLMFLSETPPIQGIIRARLGNGQDAAERSSYEEWIARLQAIFKVFAREKPYYMQLCYLDETGRELVRVDSDGTTPHIIPRGQLQDKGDRYYFKETRKLAAKEMYVSTLDLNREKGEIEVPYKPVIRYATAVYGPEGKNRGIVVTNILADNFLEELETWHGYAEGKIFLIDNNGFYIHHPDKTKEWGGAGNLNVGASLLQDYSSDVVSQVLSGRPGQITAIEDQVISYQPIFPDPRNKKVFWVLMVSVSKSLFLQPMAQFRNILIGTIFMVIIITIFIGIFFSKLLTTPIHNLILTTKKISKGDLTVKAEVTAQDEIGELADSFNKMTEDLMKSTISIDNLHKEITERKKAEEQRESALEALKESEVNYQDLYDNAPDMFFSVDAKTAKIIRCNQTSAQKMGYAVHELIGRSIIDIYHPDCLEAFKKTFQEFKQHGSVVNRELQIKRKDGSKLEVMLNASAIRDEQGSILHSMSILRDITGQKRAEEEIRKLSRAVEQSPSTVVITDTEGTIEYVNPKFTQITGYTMEEVMGKNTRILKSGKQPAELYKKLWTTITSGGEWRGEFHNKNKNGELFWASASISAIKNPEGVITHFLAVEEDITKRKKAEEQRESALKALKEMAMLPELNPGPCLKLDRHGTVLIANQAVRELFGDQHLVGKPWTSVCPDRKQEDLVLLICEQSILQREVQIDGLTFLFTYRNIPESGYILVFGTNITERKASEKEIRLLYDELAGFNKELEKRIEEKTHELSNAQAQLFQTSKLATLGEMATGIAHEINQPLGAISLVAQIFRKLIQKEKLSQEEIESGLTDIEHSVTRMSRIIQHIRIFARQETLEFTQVDVNETLVSALSLLGERLKLHAIEVIREFSGALPKITGDSSQLEQVWINLISNAHDALIEAGKMRKGNEEKYQKKISISTNLSESGSNKSIVICVKDNGAGIAKDKKDKVFEPFFTTKEVGKGTGLGLSISYGIIKSHKGKIEMESTEGEGSTVTVVLPV